MSSGFPTIFAMVATGISEQTSTFPVRLPAAPGLEPPGLVLLPDPGEGDCEPAVSAVDPPPAEACDPLPAVLPQPATTSATGESGRANAALGINGTVDRRLSGEQLEAN